MQKTKDSKLLDTRKMIFNNITKVMAVKSITLKELHKRSGINYTQLSRYFDLSVDIGLNNLLKICRGLDCSLSELVNYRSSFKDFETKLNDVHDWVKVIFEKMSQEKEES